MKSYRPCGLCCDRLHQVDLALARRQHACPSTHSSCAGSGLVSVAHPGKCCTPPKTRGPTLNTHAELARKKRRMKCDMFSTTLKHKYCCRVRDVYTRAHKDSQLGGPGHDSCTTRMQSRMPLITMRSCALESKPDIGMHSTASHRRAQLRPDWCACT